MSYPSRATNTLYSQATFRDGRGLPPGDFLDRHVLIVYSSPVTITDLASFKDFKQRLGFHVELQTVSAIAGTQPGRDLTEKIRNWLKSRWEALRPDPVYALLVGRADVVPMRPIAWAFDAVHLPLSDPTYHPAVPTDWYYADLDSNWDPDGDNYFGEGLGCRFQDCWRDPAPIELPRGTTASADDDWTAEISIARIGVNQPAEVRAALGAAMAAEMSGSPVKRRALLAASFWGFKGRSWDKDPGKYVQPSNAPLAPDTFLDGSIYYDWDGAKPFGDDSAEQYEAMLKPIFDRRGIAVRRLYEATSPGGDPALVPTRQPFDLPLSFETLSAEWTGGGFGLVQLTGHGDPNGLHGQSWQNDWNRNGRIENPANPAETAGRCASADVCWELGGWYPLISSTIGDPRAVPPIVFANGCSTGGVSWVADGRDDAGNVINLRYGPPAIAGSLPAQGKVAAWIGCLTVCAVHGLDAMQGAFTQKLIELGLPVGDAFWNSMRDHARANTFFDWRQLVPDLFGDPSASYWGNPADLRSPWPQAGRDWLASSSTYQSATSLPRLAWVSEETNVTSPPVIELSGSLIVGRTTGWARYSTYGQLHLQGGGAVSVSYSPVITTHGWLYVTGSTLRSFDRFGVENFETNLTTAATGDPRVGPDGAVWVPTAAGMARVLGDARPEILEGGAASGSMAMTPSGAVVWPSGNGLNFFRMDREGRRSISRTTLAGAGATLTAPACTTLGLLVVGSSNGVVYTARQDGTRGWTYDTRASITARPTIGRDGRVYVGNSAGDVVCIAADGTGVWLQALETPAQAPLAADGNHLYAAVGGHLLILDTHSGDIVHDLDLEGPTGPQSSPVISLSSTIYVTRADGRIVAINQGWEISLPANVVAEALPGGRFQVSWEDTSAGEAGFSIETCGSEGNCDEHASAGANAESAVIAGLRPGSPLVVRVRAIGTTPGGGAVDLESHDASSYAYSAPVVALPAVPPASSSLLVEGLSSESLSVSWKFPGDRTEILGFELRRKLGTGGVITDLAGVVGADSTSFMDTGLEADTTYSYVVISFSDAGPSEPSQAASGRTKKIALTAPGSPAATAIPAGVDLSWLDVETGETGYVVERQVEGLASWETSAQLGAGATSFGDRDRMAPGRVQYRIKAISEASESPWAYASTVAGPTPVTTGKLFLRGDANADGRTDLSDTVTILGFLFGGSAAPICRDAADTNDQGEVNISSAIYLLGYLFNGGPPPPSAYPRCGEDPTADGLAECGYPRTKCSE